MEPKVSIIIPNFNGLKLLESNLPRVERAAAAPEFGVEIVVVDDASNDGSAAWLEERRSETLKPVLLKSNKGFPGACLEGVKAARGEIVYFLNTDIRPEEGFLTPVVRNFESPDVFAVASLAYDGDGSRVLGARSGLTWKLGMPDVDRSLASSEFGKQAGPTLFASGGHSAYRRQLFLEFGGFDELFAPFYWEDVDLCFRAWKKGYRVLFEPESIVYHDHQGTISGVATASRIETVQRRNRLLFTWKNIDSPVLQTIHAILLPINILLSFAAGARTGPAALLQAIRLVPAMLKSRYDRKEGPVLSPKSDKELFRFFRESALGGRPSVCRFGAFPVVNTRSDILKTGLERRGVRVVDCRVPISGAFNRYAALVARYTLEARGCKAIWVAEARQLDTPLAKAIGSFTGARVVLDAFISHYDTWVNDRGTFAPDSRQASSLKVADRCAAYADYILMDTDAHADFYSERYSIPKNKFRRVLVGADDSVYTPSEEPPEADGFKALFFGSFLPLHGADVIIKAAKILEKEDIEFILVGEGDTHDGTVSLSRELGARNVLFSPSTTFSGVAKHISACHVCLGIFGTTEKARRVIPNKAYQALACGRALVTADTPAIREILADRENVLLCRAGDPESLAGAILELKRDPELRLRIASTGYKLFKNNFTPEKIVGPMLETLGIRPE